MTISQYFKRKKMNFSHFIDFFIKKIHNIEKCYKTEFCFRFQCCTAGRSQNTRLGRLRMGKIDENKKQKENALLQTAFELFTEKGFSKTTISDIVNKAGLAKGTFYLYFKDKYDLRDKLISFKSAKLFEDAKNALEETEIDQFQDQLLFMTDYIIRRFQNEPALMEFVAKNLSYGIFISTFSDTRFLVSQEFYEHYLYSMEKYHIKCQSPELMLFTILELIGSTSYNCILRSQPVSMDEYLPYLHKVLKQIMNVFIEQDAAGPSEKNSFDESGTNN